MSSDLAISVRGLAKAYTIRHQHESQVTLAEQALHFVRHPLTRSPKETFWALDDVSFDVHKGEVLGVIGRNGAGKSTLLKVLSRITAPTKGEVRLYGRVGSLLEVGTGFHPELTGRENVYLNGSILGMRRKEIDKQFDAIVDFAGVERFLDTPVKRYSSGMYVRLAFAVAAHLESEILLVDEVLAVGDAEFQRKCLGKMGEVAGDGRSVLLVSHQIPAVQALAHQALELHKGVTVAHGPTDEITSRYLDSATVLDVTADLTTAARGPWPQTGALRLCSAVEDGAGERGTDTSTIRVTVENVELREPEFALVATLNRPSGEACAAAPVTGLRTPPIGSRGTFEINLDTSSLVPGRYRLLLVAATFAERIGHTDHDIVPDALLIDVAGPRSRAMVGTLAHWPPTWGTQALRAWAS